MTENKRAPTPRQYTIKVDVMVPTTITYQVMAIDEAEAIRKLEQNHVTRTNSIPHLGKQIKLKATVYMGGTSTIKHTKTYRRM